MLHPTERFHLMVLEWSGVEQRVRLYRYTYDSAKQPHPSALGTESLREVRHLTLLRRWQQPCAPHRITPVVTFSGGAPPAV